MLFPEMIVAIKKYRELHGDIVFEAKSVGALRVRPQYEEQQQTCWTCGDKFKKDMYEHVKEKHADAGNKPGGKFAVSMPTPVNKDSLVAKANKVLAAGLNSFSHGGLQYGRVPPVAGGGKMDVWELHSGDEDHPGK